jgi:hypothetical protein
VAASACSSHLDYRSRLGIGLLAFMLGLKMVDPCHGLLLQEVRDSKLVADREAVERGGLFLAFGYSDVTAQK